MIFKQKTKWVVDQPTPNGRIYSRELMQKAIDEFMNKKVRLGYLSKDPVNHPTEPSHCVNEMTLGEDGYIETTIETLNTSEGKILNGLIHNFPEYLELNLHGLGKVMGTVVSDYEIVDVNVYLIDP